MTAVEGLIWLSVCTLIHTTNLRKTVKLANDPRNCRCCNHEHKQNNTSSAVHLLNISWSNAGRNRHNNRPPSTKARALPSKCLTSGAGWVFPPSVGVVSGTWRSVSADFESALPGTISLVFDISTSQKGDETTSRPEITRTPLINFLYLLTKISGISLTCLPNRTRKAVSIIFRVTTRSCLTACGEKSSSPGPQLSKKKYNIHGNIDCRNICINVLCQLCGSWGCRRQLAGSMFDYWRRLATSYVRVYTQPQAFISRQPQNINHI